MQYIPDLLTDHHFAYLEVFRHFHPESQRWAGGDALYTALENGWVANSAVGLEERWRSGGHGTPIYYFDLTRGDDRMLMPVIGNPYVRRLIRHMKAVLVPVEPKHGWVGVTQRR